MVYVIVVTRVGVMYLICINQGRGRVAPEAEVNTNQIHRIPTRVTNTVNPEIFGVKIFSV